MPVDIEAVFQESIRDLKKGFLDLSKKVQELIDLSNKQSNDHENIREHRRVLFGTEKEVGLIADVADLKRWRTNVDRLLWIVITPLLTAIGGGIVYLIWIVGSHAGQ